MHRRARCLALLFTLGLAACGSGGAELVDDGAAGSTIGETRGASAPASTGLGAESDVPSTTVVHAPSTSQVPSSTVPATLPTIDVDGVPLKDVLDIGSDQWVVPAWIPEGMSLQYLAAQSRTVSVGPPDWPEGEILLEIGGRGIGNQDPAATPNADGWIVDAGASSWSATRRYPSTSIFVLSSGLTQPFDQRFLDGLRVVNAVDLPIEPLDFGSPHHRVATSGSGEVSMSVAGGHLGWYSVEVDDATASSAAGPQHFDRTTKVGVFQGGFTSDDVTVRAQPHGFVTPDVAVVELDLVSGQTVTVIPVDESGKHDDRFWIIEIEIPLSEGSDLYSGRFVLEARAVDRDGNVIGRWRHDDPPFELPKAPLPDAGPIRAPNELVVERRAPTDEERDRLDSDATLQCDNASSAQWDYGEIGPDEPRDRVSDDALRDGIDDDTSGTSLPTQGWTELLFGPGQSTFVHTIDDWRAIVRVGGDPDLGVWRFFEYTACAD